MILTDDYKRNIHSIGQTMNMIIKYYSDSIPIGNFISFLSS